MIVVAPFCQTQYQRPSIYVAFGACTNREFAPSQLCLPSHLSAFHAVDIGGTLLAPCLQHCALTLYTQYLSEPPSSFFLLLQTHFMLLSSLSQISHRILQPVVQCAARGVKKKSLSGRRCILITHLNQLTKRKKR